MAAETTGRRATRAPQIDYVNAIPLPLPLNPASPASPAGGAGAGAWTSGFEPGEAGGGRTTKATRVPINKALSEKEEPPAPPEFGTGGAPYTTALQPEPSVDPYRRAGKLFFKDGAGSFICSASLIKRGVIVTAAHCVSDYGRKRFYTDFQFVPAYKNGAAPYGVWDWEYVRVPTVYYRGKDECSTDGVVCENDVAVIVLKDQGGAYPGADTGWFGYAWGGYSYNKSKQAHITQLGYPGAINNGVEMIRTDSQGRVVSGFAKNMVIGSQQTGGSGGGPWLVNFGPATSPDGVGKDGKRNMVVGATSWGYVSTASKEQGASPFTEDNIKSLVTEVCAAYPGACD